MNAPDCVQVLRGPHDATSRIFWGQYAKVMAAKNTEPVLRATPTERPS